MYDVRAIALVACFSALYSVLSLLPISPVIGLPGKAVTAAAILAPLIGIILGPYRGLAATTIGGLVGWFANLSFSPPSLVSGMVAAYCAGLLISRRRGFCIFTYSSLLFAFAFYPFVGPVWIYPPVLWFQIIGLVLLSSPLQSTTVNYLRSDSTSKLTFAIFTVALSSTLAGQIAGSLTSEALAWPVFVADINVWRGIWQIITILYPIERIVIAIIATLIGSSLIGVLKHSNLAKIMKTSVGYEKNP